MGATQGAACFGAAYEFVFNVAYQLKRHGLAKRVPVHYVSAEPFPGHFGIGGLAGGEKMLGMFFRMTGIKGVFDVAMEEVAPGQLLLRDGRRFPFRYAMIVPPFVGADVVKHSGLGNPRGFIDVKDTYQTLEHPNVYAVGIAAAVNAPWHTANAVGVPKTGFPSETMAHVAATNIASRSEARSPHARRTSPRCPPSASWTPGTTGSRSSRTGCFRPGSGA